MNADITILYIEDDPAHTRLVARQLQHSGYTVHAVSSGKEGLYQAEKIAPDVILLDINLPDMDGLQVARLLRSRPRCGRTPIIAITANTGIKDRDTALEAGCDMYLPKPVSKVELLKAIKTFVAYVNPAGAGV